MWVLFDVKSLTKLQLRQLAVMRWNELVYNASEFPPITAEMKSETKPGEIPAGKTLKFFPDDTDVVTVINARKAATGIGLPLQNPPWTITFEDQPAAAWATNALLTTMFLPRLTPDGNIDYFPSYLHMIEGRNTQTTPGRFIRLFWDTLNDTQDNLADRRWGALTDDALRQWTEIPKAQTPDDVQFATTPDDIEKVYLTGPSSCMTKPADYFGGVHPSRVYGAGDLAIAYLKKRRGEGIAQRAMCWPAKKIYSRIYGTGPLEDFLKALGYVNGKFDGAKLLKLHPPKQKKDYFVLPYVDYHDYVVERRDHLVIFHKEEEHPIVPGLMVTRSPRTQRNWWGAMSSTSGLVKKRQKCCSCPGLLTVDDVNNGYESCAACRKHMQRCPECSSFVKVDAPGWVRFTNAEYAKNRKTWKDLVLHGLVAGFCPECAKHKKARIATLKKDGYFVIKERDVTHAG